MKTIKISRAVVVIFTAILSLFITSCVDEVPIDREFDETQKLVLYSRLCPQLDTTYILLTNTELLYTSTQQETLKPENGVVELSADGDHWVRAAYLPEKERFFLTKQEFPVEEGHTYYIRASYAGYDEVSSSCTVPYSHDVSFRFDTVSAIGDVHLGEIYDWPHKDVYAEWRDVPGEENYYALYLYRDYVMQIENPDGTWSTLNALSHYELQWMYVNNADYRYVSDEGRDGSLMRYMVTGDLIDDYYDDYDEEDDDEDNGQYYLFFLDRNSYLYEQTLSGNEFGFDMNFLLLEPVHTYTNIKNGFGFFGAFSMRPVGPISRNIAKR